MSFQGYFQERKNLKMKNKFYFLCISFMISVCLFGQSDKDSLNVKINAKWSENLFKLNSSYISKNKDTLKITQLKFYISDFQVMYDDNTVELDKKSHLIDFEKPNTSFLNIAKNYKKKIKSINFCIGVDSLASVSGALSGDLDPSNGMYWAWQSGYINMKIEGTSSSCKTRKNTFNFHIGGYLKPYKALRKIEIPMNQIQNQINLTLDLERFFSEINLKEINSVIIPGNKAMELANLSSKMFYTE
jgi:hypothetical protein